MTMATGRGLGRGGLKALEWGAYGITSAAKFYTDSAWHALGGHGSPLGSLGRSIAKRIDPLDEGPNTNYTPVS